MGEHGERQTVAPGAQRADLLAVGEDGGAGGRARPLDPDRDEAALDQAAIAGAGGQLLAHVAAFGPGNRPELVIAGLKEQGLFRLQVTRAIGDAEKEAMRVPGIGARVGRQRRRAQEAGSGPRMARIGGGEDSGGKRRRRPVPGGMDAPFRARLGQRHRHAQPITPEAAEEIRDLRPRAIQQKPLAIGKNQEIGEPAAVRGEEGGEHRLSGRRQSDVVGDQALEKGDAIGAGEGDHAAFGKLGDLCHGRKPGGHERKHGRRCEGRQALPGVLWPWRRK